MPPEFQSKPEELTTENCLVFTVDYGKDVSAQTLLGMALCYTFQVSHLYEFFLNEEDLEKKVQF